MIGDVGSLTFRDEGDSVGSVILADGSHQQLNVTVTNRWKMTTNVNGVRFHYCRRISNRTTHRRVVTVRRLTDGCIQRHRRTDGVIELIDDHLRSEGRFIVNTSLCESKRDSLVTERIQLRNTIDDTCLIIQGKASSWYFAKRCIWDGRWTGS